jgi:SecD/SecF fusion protein
VIVFDRIRENVPRMPRATFSQIANRSMSEVFTRSLATSFVVLMPVGSLLLFGGETLKDFAFALLVGVLSGAYSSIFIATPVLVEWKEREQTYMRRRRLMLQEHGGHIPAFATGTLGEPAAAPAGARATAGTPAATAGATQTAAAAQAPGAAQPEVSDRQARRQRRAAAGASRSTTTARPAPPTPSQPARPTSSQPATPAPAPPPERAAEPSAETPASPAAPAAPAGDGDGAAAKPKPKSKSKRQQKRRKHGRR